MHWTSAAERLANAGEGLVEIGGNVGQLPRLGVRRQAEGDPGLMDFFKGLFDGGFSRPIVLTTLIEFLPCNRMAGEERVCPLEIGPRTLEAGLLALQGRHACPQEGDLVVDILHRPLELPPQAARLSQDRSNLGLGGLEVGLGADHGRLLDVDLHLVRFAIELDQQVALLHAIVVIDQDPGHLARHPGATSVTSPLT